MVENIGNIVQYYIQRLLSNLRNFNQISNPSDNKRENQEKKIFTGTSEFEHQFFFKSILTKLISLRFLNILPEIDKYLVLKFEKKKYQIVLFIFKV